VSLTVTRSVGGGYGWLAGDTDVVAGWPVSIQPGADAERYRCACLYCTQGLAGHGDGYQCGLDWGVLVPKEEHLGDMDRMLTGSHV